MRSVLWLVVGLVVGGLVGMYALAPSGETEVATSAESEAETAAAQPEVRWRMGSTFPGSLVQLGTLGKRLEEQIATISGGNFNIKFFEPGALVPALELFDAVSTGSVDAGWSTPGYWAGKVPALQFFSAVPFGPRAAEYMAWIIKALLCGVIPPEASGWFSEPINGPADLEGLKMRFFGLGAKVMEKLGVSTQLLAGGDIFPALELGTIDATEFSMPAIDLNLGFYQVAKHYYFPGWHQQSTLFELIMNVDRYNALTDKQKAQIASVCGDQFRHSIAEGEYIQIDALNELENHGVELQQWSDEMLSRYEAAWNEVVEEEAAADPDFKRVWESLKAFRESYDRWEDLGYL